ncbi:MAG: AraC family transcriptional regulator [Corynebacterium sp.]|nr:AraC family transcriptional regulator [Corynebacterium sp.]
MTQPVELRFPVFFWTLTGSAHVVVGRGTSASLRLGEGRGVWVNAGQRLHVDRGPDAVVLGMRCRGDDALPFTVDGGATTGAVDAAWHDRLVDQFASSLGYLQEEQRGPAPAAMPTSTGAREAARILLDDLSTPVDVADLASAVHLSAATLHRRFREETALSVGQWRARARVAAAEAYLREPGATLASAAHRVGLSSASALSRLMRTTSVPVRAPVQAGAARSTWPRTNRMHVLVWVYRGSARVSAGELTVDLGEGELTWLPAGIPNVVRMDAGSLVLPVGARVGRTPRAGGPVRVHPQDAAALLAASAREYDPIEPTTTALVDGLFYGYLAHGSEDDRQGSRLMTRLLEEFHRQPSSDRSVGQWAELLGCTRDELDEALDGGFRRWRTSARMGIARQLLFAGVDVRSIAKHLGYSGTSSFSHVFAREHGVPPSGYRGYV